MSARIYCGKCGKKFRVHPEHAGQRGKCSRCGSFIPIPQSSFDQTLFRLICDSCGKGIKSPITYAGKTISCPGCEARIRLPVIEDEDAESPESAEAKVKRKPADPSKTADTKLLADAARTDEESGERTPGAESTSRSGDDTFDIELIDEPNHDENLGEPKRPATSPRSQSGAKPSRPVEQVRVELDAPADEQQRYELPDQMEKAIDRLEEALAQKRSGTNRREAQRRVGSGAPPEQAVSHGQSSGHSQALILVGGAVALVALIVLLIVLIMIYSS